MSATAGWSDDSTLQRNTRLLPDVQATNIIIDPPLYFSLETKQSELKASADFSISKHI